MPGQTPEQRAAELKRRHVEVRRKQAHRRRLRSVLILAVLGVLVVVVGIVAVRGREASGRGSGSAKAVASPSPRPAATLAGAIATTAEPSPQSAVAKTPPATPTGDPEPALTGGSAGTPASTQAATPTILPAATPAATPAPTPAATPDPESAPRFQAARALADVRALADLGVRRGGSATETRGAEYIAAHLRATGIPVKIRTFTLIDGKTSRNVIGIIPGGTSKTVILGAHMDSKPPSPGANDNGTGCGTLLELGRCLTKRAAYPTVKLVFFGTEEMIDADPDHHHYGSRAFVRTMSRTARGNAAGMISVDMVGYGPDFVVRSMGVGPQSLRYLLLADGRREHVRMSYLQDTAPSGSSDHEAFARDQIPAAWLEWREDPVYHTAADTSGHLVKAKVQTTGQFLLDVLYRMDEAQLRKLAR